MFLLNEDTICAPATVPGTGAISVIRVSGPEALHAVSSVVHCAAGRDIASAPGFSARFGHVYTGDGASLDDLVVTVFRAPHSYTGEDSAEISCHASRYIVDNILLLLAEHGIRAAAPGEFTRRAFLNGKMDLAQAEAVADLIAAESASAHRVALTQLKGGFSKELRRMRDQLLNIVSLMELELDFSEEEVEFADRSELLKLVDEVDAHIGGLVSSFRLGNAIKNGIPVAIAGATNTGKSTLLNALLGEDRAIVSDVHGTTRDTIEETLNMGGLLFRFIDTAGIRKTDESVEMIGIERTFRKLEEAVVVLAMIDLGKAASLYAASGDDREAVLETYLSRVMSDVLDKLDPARQKVVFVLNKIDVLGDDGVHRGLRLHHGVRIHDGEHHTVLHAGRVRRDLPGRHTGHVQILLLPDHPAPEGGGVLRTNGHLRKRCVVHGDVHGLRDKPVDRQHVRRDPVACRAVRHRTPAADRGVPDTGFRPFGDRARDILTPWDKPLPNILNSIFVIYTRKLNLI